MRDVVVLKFGSSVLGSRDELPGAVHEIYRWYREGHPVIAVASAIGAATDGLLAQAREITSEPEPHALAELLATGERSAAALLALALDRAGVPARVVDPREIRLTAQGDVLDGEPTAVNPAKLEEMLAASPVLVIPGFFGHDAHGRLRLLGRGGSDLTAIFLASATRASRCRLIKDVDGVYDHDPSAASTGPAQLFAAIDYASAIENAAQLVQPKAVRFLERHKATAEVAGLARPYETLVGHLSAETRPTPACPPARVLLLGLGTVGLGVYRRLRALPQHFRVVGALCRYPARQVAAGLPPELLHAADSRAALPDADIVVDALPGDGPSFALLSRCLAAGVHAVTANKQLVAAHGRALERLAAASGAELRYAAAVGGSAPMLEAVGRHAAAGGITGIAGILNGTTNFILDGCASGLAFGDAVRAAQERGFAEADPSQDLDGKDAERKLRILARSAFGREPDGIEVEPLDAERQASARLALRAGQALRQVARAWRDDAGLRGEVRLRALDASHPLAAVHAEWNALLITRDDGTTDLVRGRGAGRWPTTEAVVADLLGIRYAQVSATLGRALRPRPTPRRAPGSARASDAPGRG
jgi:homoserine dehydrogenase